MYSKTQLGTYVTRSDIVTTTQTSSPGLAIATTTPLKTLWSKSPKRRPSGFSVVVQTFFAVFVNSMVLDRAEVVAQALPDPPVAGAEAIFRFDPKASHVLVPVDFNGRRRLFVVDTGMGASAFDISFVDELGSPLRSVELQTPQGSKNTLFFGTPVASVGGLPLSGVSEVLCIDFWRYRAGSGTPIYGCLGLDFLRQYVVRLDFDRGEIAFLTAVPDDSGTPIALHIRTWRRPPVVMVGLPWAGRQPFFVGTGCDGFGDIDKQLLNKLIENGMATVIDTVLIESLTKSRPQRKARLRGDLSLGENRCGGPAFIEADDNTLGLGFLRRYLVTFDFPGQKLYLKDGLRRSERTGKTSCGATIWRPNGATTVRDVKAASAAAIAGLQAGDVVEEIDLQLASSLALSRVHELLSTPGKQILHVRRDDQSVRIVLQVPERSGQLNGTGQLNEGN